MTKYFLVVGKVGADRAHKLCDCSGEDLFKPFGGDPAYIAHPYVYGG